MIFNPASSSLAVLLSLALTATARSDGPSWRRHHNAVARAVEADNGYNATESLEARAPGSRWTWYNTETGNRGSCGEFIQNHEFVVARAAVDMNKDRDCFRRITISFEGRTAEAVIKDTCPECPPNALDLSAGLFKHIAPNGDGVVYGDWWFNDSPPATTTRTPTATPTPTPTPTSTTPTTSSAPPPQTTSSTTPTTSSTPPPQTTSSTPPTTSSTPTQTTTTRSTTSVAPPPTSTSPTTPPAPTTTPPPATSSAAPVKAPVTTSLSKVCRRRKTAPTPAA